MASVRTINVGDISYLQVVEYVGGKTKVLKSFGRDAYENRLRAYQFANNYNGLEELAKKESQNEDPDFNEFLTAAGVVFGIILGAVIISEIIKRYEV